MNWSVQSLGWPKSSFGIFYSTLWKNSNELFGQHNTLAAEISWESSGTCNDWRAVRFETSKKEAIVISYWLAWTFLKIIKSNNKITKLPQKSSDSVQICQYYEIARLQQGNVCPVLCLIMLGEIKRLWTNYINRAVKSCKMLWGERIPSIKKSGKHCPVVITPLTYFLKEFFLDHLKKSLLNWLQHCFYIMLWVFGHGVCRILAPWPGTELALSAVEVMS